MPPRPNDARPRLVYLCLQPMSEGQASYAHVTEILSGLSELGWKTDLHATTTPPSAGLVRRLLDSVRLQRRPLGRSLRSTDVLYVRWHPTSIVSVLQARRRSVPVVLEVNGPPEDITAAWPALRALRWLICWSLHAQLNQSTAVITVTAGLAKWLQGLAPRVEVSVVPNAADPQRFHPAAARDSEATGPYALFFGALAPWQGIELLLEATKVTSWPPDLPLLVVGDGPMREPVEAAARERPDRVKYLGRRAYAQMPALIAASSVVVIPKDYHRPELGLSPLKLYESMAASTAVVVTDVPGLGDVVARERCGIVVRGNSPQVLATAVAAAATKPHLGERGRDAAVARHTWRDRAEATDRLLQGVVTKAPNL